MGLILSIDLGTTNLKAGVVRKDGEILTLARRQLDVERPTQRAAEHCPRKLMKLLTELCKEVSENYRKEISLISVSTYQFGLILLDRNYEPITGITTLLETRARLTHERFSELFSPVELYERTGCPPFTQYPLARLFYLREREPEVLEKAAHILSAKAYLLFKLTGQLITDPSTDSASQMLNIHTQDWDAPTLETIGLDRSLFPEVVEPHKDAIPLVSELREEIGLSPKVKVLPGVYDAGALVAALGGLEPRVGTANLGTTGFFTYRFE